MITAKTPCGFTVSDICLNNVVLSTSITGRFCSFASSLANACSSFSSQYNSCTKSLCKASCTIFHPSTTKTPSFFLALACFISFWMRLNFAFAADSIILSSPVTSVSLYYAPIQLKHPVGAAHTTRVDLHWSLPIRGYR